MSWKTTLVLLIVAAIVGGVMIYDRMYLQTTEEAKERAKDVFPGFKSEDATKIEIKRDGETVVLEKVEEDKWRLRKPLDVRADRGEVSSILSGLEFLEKEGEVKPEKGKAIDLKEYGLDKPRIEVAFWVKGKGKKEKEGRKLVLKIGSKTAVGDNVYAMGEEKDYVFVVSDSIVDKLKKSINELRDKVVIEIDKDKVEKIEIARADGSTIECSLEKDGWHMVRPIADLADKSEVESLIDKLSELRVDKDDFISEDDSDLAKYGLDKPRLTATVYQKGAAKTVIFGKKVEGKSGKIYAKRKAEHSILAVKESIIDDLTKEPKELRERRLVRFDSTDDVVKIELTEGKTVTVLEKKDDEWKMIKPKEEKADSSSVGDFLDALKDLKIQEWVEDKAKNLKKYGLDKPARVVKLTLKGKKGERQLLIGSKDAKGKRLYAKRGTGEVVVAIKPDFLEKVTGGRLLFMDRLILDFSKTKSKKLTVKRPDKTFVCEVDNEGNWHLLKPIKCDVDQNEVDDILYDLSYLKAKRYVAENPKDLTPYGLANPAITATVVYEEEIKEEKKEEEEEGKEEEKEEEKPKTKLVTKTLLVGKKAKDDTWYAMLKGGNLVFTISDSVHKNLLDELATKMICKFDKDDAKRITLTYPTKEVVYEKKDDKWRMVKPKEKRARTSDIDDILNTLNYFKADGIEVYSTTDPKKYGLDKPQLKIAVGLKEGEKIVLIGKKKDDDKYFVKGEPSNFIYIVSKDDVEKLMKEKPEAPKKEEKKPAAKKAAPAKKEAKPAPKPAKEEGKKKPTAPVKKPATKAAPQQKAPAKKPQAKSAPEQKAPAKKPKAKAPSKPAAEAKPAQGEAKKGAAKQPAKESK